GEVGSRRTQRTGLAGGFSLFVGQRRVVTAPALSVVEFGEQLARVLVFALQTFGDVCDPLDQRCRVDSVLFVVGDLNGPPAVGLVDGGAHRIRDRIGVHVHLAVEVTCGTTDRLDERGR